MTLVHGGRSGRRIRTRLDDEPLGGHRELDDRRRLGREPRREPPRVHRARQPRALPQAVLRAERSAPNKKAAKLIVIDPRKTRTALQVDEPIGDSTSASVPEPTSRFSNGLLRYMIDKIEGAAERGSGSCRVLRAT